MTKTRSKRKKEFLAALAYFGETQDGWATRHGITKGHLGHVLAGRRESGRVDRLVDEYVTAFKAKVASNHQASGHPRKPVVQLPTAA